MILMTTNFCYENGTCFFKEKKKTNQIKITPLHLFTIHNMGFKQLSHTSGRENYPEENITCSHLLFQHLKKKKKKKSLKINYI